MFAGQDKTSRRNSREGVPVKGTNRPSNQRSGEEEGYMITTWGLDENVVKGILLAGILSAVGFGMPVPAQAADAANKLVSEEEFSALFASADSPAATTDTTSTDTVHK